MAGRLLALVMVPVTGMCLIAGSVVLSRRGAAQRASDIDNSVPTLNAMAELSDSLHVEQSIVEGAAKLEARHLTPAQIISLIGYDFNGLRDPARDRSDHAIAVLGTASPVAASALKTLRAQVDSHAISSETAGGTFRFFSVAARDALHQRIDELEREARESGAAQLGEALETLRLTSDSVKYGSDMAIDFGEVAFPSGHATPAAALALVLADDARYTEANDRLRQLGDPAIIATFVGIKADPLAREFETAVLDTEQGGPPPTFDSRASLARIGDIFRGGDRRYRLLDNVILLATEAVHDASHRLEASERGLFVKWAAGTMILASLSIIIALWFARSISAPLRRLADYAHAINEGQLDNDAVPARAQGPGETRVIFDAVSDLASNLRLLDAKAQALASCDFENPVLSEALPGQLGRSLQSSVEVLSGSIVERENLQQRLAYQASHDQLTGMHNRAAAIAGIRSAMDRAARSRSGVAVVFIDLDDFKAVNDSHGHKVGDELLRQVGLRMEGVLRGGELAARLGGDEFVVIAEGIHDLDEAMALARRLIDTVNKPIDIDAVHLNAVSASAGIAMALEGPDDPLRLLARADLAMYRAKGHGRATIQVFDTALQGQLQRREDIEKALSAALAETDGGGLIMYYQPVVDTMSGQIVSVEALVRWDRAGHGLVQPDSFIGIAEASPMIIDLDCWVLDSAARQIASWSADPELCNLTVAVNVSGRHLLSKTLPEHIRIVLAATHIDPRRLTIEITETVLLADLEVASAELDAVRALGIRVAIDDFGTGYTSLAHLQQLPIDVIKIDRSFIIQLGESRGESLVRMITDLGHSMGVTIIAEGVETDAELGVLQTLGSDKIQGYLFSRPLPPRALSEWVHDRAPTPSAPGATPAL